MPALPVIVAGGGIAGLSAALALAAAGRPVLLFERDQQPSEEGAGVQLSPNASRHLRAWGVLDRIEPLALAPDAVIVRRAADAAELSRLNLTDAAVRYGASFRVVHRADLHAALRVQVSMQDHVKVEAGVAVTGWRTGETLRVLTDDDRAHEAAALIVADGVQSRLRRTFDNQQADLLKPSGRTAWRALLPAGGLPAWATAPSTNLWLGRDAHLVHYPLRGGTVVNVVAVVGGKSAGSDASDSWARPGETAALASRFARWHAYPRELLARASSWRVWPLFSRAAPRELARGRVAIAGDAAHPMMPFLAQGAAQAIEDAAALGTAFAVCDNPEAALMSYDRHRRGRVGRIVAASERQATLYHLGGVAAQARDLAMRLGGESAIRLTTDWIYRA